MKKKKCWMCGNIANSGEHRIKQSDLKSLYGDNIGEDGLLILEEDQSRVIKSIKSKFLKSKVLCQNCNNKKTQPFDKSYEKFIKYIDDNKEEIIHKRFINFDNVFGEKMEEGQRNLYKYLVKSFGCRLSKDNHPIPQDLINLIDKEFFKTGLRITFAINEVMLNHKYGLDQSVGNGDITVNQSYIDGTNKVLFYTYSQHYKWLDIYYYHNYLPNGSLGSTWTANNQFIYLGTSYDNTSLNYVIRYNLRKIKWSSIP